MSKLVSAFVRGFTAIMSVIPKGPCSRHKFKGFARKYGTSAQQKKGPWVRMRNMGRALVEKWRTTTRVLNCVLNYELQWLRGAAKICPMVRARQARFDESPCTVRTTTVKEFNWFACCARLHTDHHADKYCVHKYAKTDLKTISKLVPDLSVGPFHPISQAVFLREY